MKQSVPGLSGILLLDGAMGTELLRRGVERSVCLEAQNLDRPGLVSSIHRDYRAAGCDILTANTFGANRFRLAEHGFEDRVRQINVAAVGLACAEASGALIAGSIGPTGDQSWQPDRAAQAEAFGEQAAALHNAGVDLFICETFGDIEELRPAIAAIVAVSSRPILAQMTYRPGPRTPLGLAPKDVVAALVGLPIAAIGVNCAVGEDTAEAVIVELAEVTRSSWPVATTADENRATTVRVRSAMAGAPSPFTRLTRVSPGTTVCCFEHAYQSLFTGHSV